MQQECAERSVGFKTTCLSVVTTWTGRFNRLLNHVPLDRYLVIDVTLKLIDSINRLLPPNVVLDDSVIECVDHCLDRLEIQ